MPQIYFRSVPYNKAHVTLALESGVDGLVVPGDTVGQASALARCAGWADEETTRVALAAKADERDALTRLRAGERVVLTRGWEVIPVENLLAGSDAVLAEAGNLDEAKLASGILERGVAVVVLTAEAVDEIKEIIAACKLDRGQENLRPCIVTRVESAGLGHRVCADTLSLLRRGEGMLVCNSSAFTFLVHAETEHNEYVAARPFRVNAGAVHAYVRLPRDKTTYLGELVAGKEMLIVNSAGAGRIATLGRVKIEVRPMLYIEAETEDESGMKTSGGIFLQNAETIRLTAPDGTPLSVVGLTPGDVVLCRIDEAGRHFGMRVREDIREI
jgi:3-dehydroquinate synthase II